MDFERTEEIRRVLSMVFPLLIYVCLFLIKTNFGRKNFKKSSVT